MTERIEGKRAVLEALKSNVPIMRILVADGLDQNDSLLRDIHRKARQKDVSVEGASKKQLDKLSERGSHQGVIAEAKPFSYVNVTSIIERANQDAVERNGRALIVVSDHIQDAGNLGAIARSAESVGASGIIIPNKRAAHITAATYKSSAGAIAHIQVSQVANITSTLERLKEAGFWMVAASEHAKDTLWETNMSGRIALVLGNEKEGVSRLVLQECDLTASLPQIGEMSSLNVAQAATVFAYEWLRQNL